jgi:hypothetical protein
MRRSCRPVLVLTTIAALVAAAPVRAGEMVVVLAPDSVSVVARAQILVQFAPSGDRKIGAKVESGSGILAFAFCEDDWAPDRVATAAKSVASHVEGDAVLDLARLLESLGLRGCRDHA